MLPKSYTQWIPLQDNETRKVTTRGAADSGYGNPAEIQELGPNTTAWLCGDVRRYLCGVKK